VGMCKPVVGAWYVMCARASVSQVSPHKSATVQFQVLMSMQMDVEVKKEQIGALSCLVGALEGGLGGFGGWMVPLGRPPQEVYVPVQNKKKASCLSYDTL